MLHFALQWRVHGQSHLTNQDVSTYEIVMIQHELDAEVLQCARAVCCNFKTEFFVKSQALPFGFDLMLLEDFIFVREFHVDKRTSRKEEMFD